MYIRGMCIPLCYSVAYTLLGGAGTAPWRHIHRMCRFPGWRKDTSWAAHTRYVRRICPVAQCACTYLSQKQHLGHIGLRYVPEIIGTSQFDCTYQVCTSRSQGLRRAKQVADALWSPWLLYVLRLNNHLRQEEDVRGRVRSCAHIRYVRRICPVAPCACTYLVHIGR